LLEKVSCLSYLSNTKLASNIFEKENKIAFFLFIYKKIIYLFKNKPQTNFKMIENDTINIEIISCLEETIDKLHISGQIMPLTYEMKKNAKAVMMINNFEFFFPEAKSF
jgi:hypothetical protein